MGPALLSMHEVPEPGPPLTRGIALSPNLLALPIAGRREGVFGFVASDVVIHRHDFQQRLDAIITSVPPPLIVSIHAVPGAG